MTNWSEFKSYKKRNLFYFQLFSVFANILLLVMPIYSLQIYNRVLTSRSTDTLFFLVIITAVLVGVQVVMDYTRQQILNNMSSVYDDAFAHKVVNRGIALSSQRKTDGQKLFKDHSLAKQYLASPFHRSLTDLPWTAAFIVVLFMLHPAIGAYALISTVILAAVSGGLLLLSYKNTKETKARSAMQMTSLQQILGKDKLDTVHLIAYRVVARWAKRNEIAINQESNTKLLINRDRSYLKMLRMTIQIGVYAVCAWLVIEQQVMGGALLASSILLGRILAPIDQGASQYFNWVESKRAYKQMAEMLSKDDSDKLMDLNLESADLFVHKLSYKSLTGREVIKNIGFNLKAGSCLSITGPSGAGKSTLLKLLVNSLEPTEGGVKINGVPANKINPLSIAKSIAYLPQEIELFNASIADNISGFDHDEKISEMIIEASKKAQAHPIIARLPQSYSSLLGQEGLELSASEKQKIALAGCFYADPKLVILDEPTLHLDLEARVNLRNVLTNMKKDGATIVFVSSSPEMQALADYVVELKDGSIQKAYENKPKEKLASPNVVSQLAPKAHALES